MQNICSALAFICAMLLCSLLSRGGEGAFEGSPKVTEDYVLNPVSDFLFPKEYKGLSCRYVELGEFISEGKLIVLNDELSSIESAALEYLNKVKIQGANAELQTMGRLSSFITEKKKSDIKYEIKRLQKILQSHDQISFVASQQTEAIAVSLFVVQKRDALCRLQASFVALLKDGDGWVPCVMPASFANANMVYEGELRIQAENFKTWSKDKLEQEAAKLKNEIQSEVSKRLLVLRKELHGADAPMLLSKLVKGARARDPVVLASVFHCKGGVEAVAEYMDRKGGGMQSLFSCLSNPNNIVVPLDPTPIVLSEEEEEVFNANKQRNPNRPSAIEQKGESGPDCALGIIGKKDRFTVGRDEVGALFYLPLYVSDSKCELPPAVRDTLKQGGLLDTRFAPDAPDGNPFLGMKKEILLNDTLISSWKFSGSMKLPATAARMARDFHRTYPAFQFKSTQEAAAVILAALWEERLTDLLRCLPAQNFKSGKALMSFIPELLSLSGKVGKLEQEVTPMKNGFLQGGPSVLLTPAAIENVVVYERGEEAVVCWTQRGDKLDQGRCSSFNLRKLDGLWYLYLPSDSIPSVELGLSKIAKQIEAFYASHQIQELCQEVPVLKEIKTIEMLGNAIRDADRIDRCVQEANIHQLLKHCLVLEDTPESRKRMVEAIVECMCDYGHQMKRSRIVQTHIEQNGAFVTKKIKIMESQPRPDLQGGSVLLEAPMLFFARQGDKLYWVPELTLLCDLYPKSKEISTQRLALAKKFLPENIYDIYAMSYELRNRAILSEKDIIDSERAKKSP